MVIRRTRRRRTTAAARRRYLDSQRLTPVRRRSSFVKKFFSAVGKTDLRLEVESRIARDIWAVIYITLGILTYLSLGGSIGRFGEWWSASFRGLFGIGINFIPLLLFAIGGVMLTSTKIIFNFTRIFGIILLVTVLLGIVHLSAAREEMLTEAMQYGGFTGFVASVFFRAAFADLGAKIVLIALFLISILLTFGISFRDVAAFIGRLIHGEEVKKASENGNLKVRDFQKEAAESSKKTDSKDSETSAKKVSVAPEFRINRPGSLPSAQEFKPEESKVSDADWNPPSLDLLDEAAKSASVDETLLRRKAELIRQKLSQFGINVEMHDVNVGPTVMQYTLKPADGMKLSKIVGLKRDLAYELAAKSLRIEAPIPGKSLVGIEIPNDKRTLVRLKELMLSDAFSQIKSNLRVVLGRDVSGNARIADLAEMPHLLVAGATGSGKSVGINTFLLSLIYQNSPNDLRLILVDPKRVELVPYNGIPHLLTPVINDPEKTISALKWAVSEMTRRYIELSKAKVRNIKEFNANKPPKKMPYIVIVIDELADLMMVAQKEVEGAIMRLAQMARAVGIHLILATQRPSVNVITGVIKANIPTRLSFAVTSGVDSKTILDCVGAEDLLGQGDMLFIPPGESKPVRIQGSFISTAEVRKVTNAIKLDLGDEPEYDDEITDSQKTANVILPGVKPPNNDSKPGGSDEEIIKQAARVVVETGRASASLLQRRLSLGYARAARIIDLLEERGFVGPAAGAKPRDIFVTAERLNELENSANDPEAIAKAEVSKQLDDLDRGRGER
ncbi:DNA translocase FtsK [Candidatus Gracilibacteria bacterium]|nr:DNA translocase FtsK [Candidatus Gracilibacteria bacterium]MCF7856748.1 DNA translocase FtsK [Candidatus Gracilibacteria bacterium]MCF7897046.1 DNA translocase FtsK [Candidatus Gracilibacteria bacterium]